MLTLICTSILETVRLNTFNDLQVQNKVAAGESLSTCFSATCSTSSSGTAGPPDSPLLLT